MTDNSGRIRGETLVERRQRKRPPSCFQYGGETTKMGRQAPELGKRGSSTTRNASGAEDDCCAETWDGVPCGRKA